MKVETTMVARIGFRLAAVLALGLFSETGMAEDTTRPDGVVELFTSQGCNSCPKADAAFAEMAAKGDVIALSYHIDYWDYLGWRDTLATPENTARQYDYMRAFGTRSVYTPQAVVNGRVQVNGAKSTVIAGALEGMSKAGRGLTVDLSVSFSGNSVVIDTAGSDRRVDGAHLLLVYFEPPQEVEIGRGENGGRKITYWNAVSGIQTAGMWHGKPARYEFPMSEITKKPGCVVLLQEAGKDGLPGPILGAAIIRKPQT